MSAFSSLSRRSACGLTLMLLLATSACGGGGGGDGGGTPTPTPANQAPSFTSAATANVVENTTDAYQAVATDPDGTALTYSIAGGADAARFSITAAGLVRFVSPPNFDSPADAGQDNVYDVQIGVTDGQASATRSVAITVTNSREGIQVRRVGTAFNQPLYVAPIPGDTRVFVVEKGGGVLTLDPATGAKAPFITVANISTVNERGLLGLAAAPDYQTSGFVYAYVTNGAGDIEVRRYRRATGGTTLLDATILTIPHPTNSNHNGGWLAFGPDGNLWLATGDGGGAGDAPNNAQNTNVLLGKILRITLNQPGGSAPFYTIPADNPFAGGAGGAPEVYAYGFRNPFRASFWGNNLIIGDVGQNLWEEVDLLRPQDKGGNYGWRFREGAHAFTGTAPAGLIDPVLEYGHGTGPKQGSTITGGYVYRGPVTSLAGHYVFADFGRGAIFTVAASAFVQGQTLGGAAFERRNEDFTPDTGTIDQLASFGEDAAGNLYIVDLDGEIYRLISA
ncbi:PQQ-dependent sugar dehydrogenase [Sphingomonas sp. ZT3P38]|uniref:PQQ-dependent sugar dehydrogenase n=1 Tax=Parasphingomonas zepuensis TaxID=3096161 RepID=UPI002FC8802A